MKKLTKIFLAALCVLLLASSMTVTVFADTPIEKVNVILNTPPTKGRKVADATAEAYTYGTRVSSYKWLDGDGKELTGDFTKTEISFELIVEAADGYCFTASTEVYLNDEYNYGTVSSDGKYVTVKKTLMPGTYAPEIKKQPGDENIEPDSLASFVATALYTSKANEWLIVSPDGNAYTADSISTAFPNTGAETKNNGEKLNIHHVDRGMNGYRVYCVFYGDGQTVFSKPATINLNGVDKPQINLSFSGGSYDAPAATADVPEEGHIDVVDGDFAAAGEDTALPIMDIPADHEHSFGTDWKYDNFGHWHECMCGETNDFEAHDYVVMTVTKATYKEPGQDYKECRICGYGVDVEIPMKESPLGIDGDTIKTVVIAAVSIVLIVVIFSIYRNYQDHKRAERRKKAKKVEAEARQTAKKAQPEKKKSSASAKSTKKPSGKSTPAKKAPAKKNTKSAPTKKTLNRVKDEYDYDEDDYEDVKPYKNSRYEESDEDEYDDYDAFDDDEEDTGSGFDFDRFR